MNCIVCNKPLEPPHQRLCPSCIEEARLLVVKELGGEEQFEKLFCWPKDDKKEGKS